MRLPVPHHDPQGDFRGPSCPPLIIREMCERGCFPLGGAEISEQPIHHRCPLPRAYLSARTMTEAPSCKRAGIPV